MNMGWLSMHGCLYFISHHLEALHIVALRTLPFFVVVVVVDLSDNDCIYIYTSLELLKC